MKYTEEICVELLKSEYDRLTRNGENRFPKRDDFSNEEVVAIKSFLGPWPRALEKAGIKETDHDREERRKQKRIRQKIKQREAKICSKRS